MITQLSSLVAPWGLTLTDKQAARFDAYHRLLISENEKIDLTNVAPEDMALMHYADSLAALALPGLIPEGAKLIDVGSGAGFPGLPLSIMREDLSVTLLDARQKRCQFLQQVVDQLQLHHVTVIHGRAEEQAKTSLRESCDIAVARAVAPLNVLLEYLLPFVKQGGKALCWKGPSLSEERQAGGQAAKMLGAVLSSPVLLPLPGLDHVLQVAEKTSPSPARYPRRMAQIKQKPLGGSPKGSQ